MTDTATARKSQDQTAAANEASQDADEIAAAINQTAVTAGALTPDSGEGPRRPDNITSIARSSSGQPSHGQMMRIVEALLFASSEPMSQESLAECLPAGTDVMPIIENLQQLYAERGVNLVKVADKWAFRTAQDLSFLLRREAVEQKRLSKAALETMAIIAYHQPVTRAEIEEIRGVSISKGTLDILLEMGWAKLRGRRRSPGKPVTYGTTEGFLEHFGLASISDLPGLSELKGAGLLSANVPSDFVIPMPRDEDDLGPDELPLEDEDEQPPLEMHLPDLSKDPQI